MKEEFQIRQYVEALGIRYRIAGLTLDADGGAGLRLGDGSEIHLRFRRATNRLYIHAVLAPLPARPIPGLALKLLKMNCLEAGSGGGVLSVSAFQRAFVYHVSLPAACIDSERLGREIEAFLSKRARAAQCLDA
ncbi:CesT family type III secretion system chaperone [Pseudoduganella sp. R-31]|uniref:CesT family type III secretion system chaperone n=1 Tax=Pseudoduganella sp. R-31 TaxID=3404060 RepID=UPI003CF2B075